jgi:hypothetical protein
VLPQATAAPTDEHESLPQDTCMYSEAGRHAHEREDLPDRPCASKSATQQQHRHGAQRHDDMVTVAAATGRPATHPRQE